MIAWSQLTTEQQAMLVNAVEHGFLTGVLDEWRAKVLWAESGSTLTPSDLDDAAKIQLIPRFAPVVADLVARGWIELGEYQESAREPVRLSGAALHAALSDPHSWVWRPDESHRMIELAATGRWDQHMAETG